MYPDPNVTFILSSAANIYAVSIEHVIRLLLWSVKGQFVIPVEVQHTRR